MWCKTFYNSSEERFFIFHETHCKLLTGSEHTKVLIKYLFYMLNFVRTRRPRVFVCVVSIYFYSSYLVEIMCKTVKEYKEVVNRKVFV